MVVTGIRHTLTRAKDFHNFNHDVVLICNSKRKGEKRRESKGEKERKKQDAVLSFLPPSSTQGLGIFSKVIRKDAWQIDNPVDTKKTKEKCRPK